MTTTVLDAALLREHQDRYESWAQRETSSGGWYGYPDVMDDAAVGNGVGQPSWCVPYKTWDDRKRRYRSLGASVADHEIRDNDGTGDKADRDLSHQFALGTGGRSLLGFHLEMNAGTGSSPKGKQGWTRGYGFEEKSNPDQLEVCRHCGADLKLLRDMDGFVIREPGGQRQYCSDRCEADADNRRDRQRRAGGKFPKDTSNWYTARPVFDLDSIAVAGAGKLGSEWIRQTPRSRTDSYRAKAGNRRDVFALPLHELVTQRRSGHGWHPKIHRWQDSATRSSGRYRLAGSRCGARWRIVEANTQTLRDRASIRTEFALRRVPHQRLGSVMEITHPNGATAP